MSDPFVLYYINGKESDLSKRVGIICISITISKVQSILQWRWLNFFSKFEMIAMNLFPSWKGPRPLQTFLKAPI